MSNFKEANQTRTALKMKLSIYSWYKNSVVCAVSDGWGIIVMVKKIDNKVRKLIPQVISGVSVKVEIE